MPIEDFESLPKPQTPDGISDTAKKDRQKLRKEYEQNKNPWKSVAETNPDQLFRELYHWNDEKSNPDIVREAWKIDPIRTFEYFKEYENHPVAQEIADQMISINPFLVLKKGAVIPPIMQKAEAQAKKMEKLMKRDEKIGISGQWQNLDESLGETNSFLPLVLQQFNKKHSCSLRCAGLRQQLNKKPSDDVNRREKYGHVECVFINTFQDESIVPIRIAISYDELLKTQDSTELLDIFERKFSEQLEDETVVEPGNTPLGKQIELWQQLDAYDLPVGKTSVLGMLLEKGDDDMNVAYNQLAHEVFQGRYQATVERGVITESAADFTNRLETSLMNAVDKNQEAFVFYYLAHGLPNGTVLMGNQQEKPGSWGDAIDIAKAISKDHNGKPLCSQIDIVINAESCFSGKQLTKIVDYLKEKNVPVKNLRIVAAANETPAAWVTENPSLINPRFEAGRYKKIPPMTYYLSYYFQMIKHLESQGKTLPPGAGTMGHAFRFADRMARDDSTVSSIGGSLKQQDVQYFHYSTEENKDELLSETDIPNQQRVV